MGANVSKDCGCLAVMSNAAYALLVKKKEEANFSVLDEDEIVPAGLLSDHEIQCLLMESTDNSRYEPV